MNRFILYVMGTILLSCSSKENSSETSGSSVQLAYEIDTVQIDAGEDFLF
ncbi:hypothetical protein V8V91_16570 [Algoriphagus halophilus]